MRRVWVFFCPRRGKTNVGLVVPELKRREGGVDGQGHEQPRPSGHGQRFSVDIYPRSSLHFPLFSSVIKSRSQILSPFLTLTPGAACHPGTSQTSSGFEASGAKNPPKSSWGFFWGKKVGNNLMVN